MKKFLVSAFIALLFVSCSKDDDVNNPGTSDVPFVFLKLGNEWRYSGDIILDSGLYTSGSYSSRIFISSLNADSSLSAIIGSSYYFFEGTLPIASFSDGATQLWSIKDDYWAIVNEPLHPSSSLKQLPILFNNNTVGKKWEVTYYGETPIAPLEIRTREILSVSETVEVPAGIFKNCVKVKETSSKDPEYYYIYWGTSKDGIVKYEKRWLSNIYLFETYATVRAELFSKKF